MAAEELLSTINKKKNLAGTTVNANGTPYVMQGASSGTKVPTVTAPTATQKATANTPILNNASKSSNTTSTASLSANTAKYAGNPLTSPAAAPAKPEMTAEQLAAQDRIDQEAYIEQGMADNNKIAEDYGLNKGASTIQEVVDKFKSNQKQVRAETEAELARQQQIEKIQADRYNEQAKGAIAASDTSFAQGREGAVSGSAAGLKNEFSEAINKSITENRIKLESAQANRDSIMRQLDLAEQAGHEGMIESLSKNLANAKRVIEESKTNYLNALAQANQQAQVAEQSTRQNLTTYTGMVDSGATMSTKGIAQMASTLNIPLELALDYYNGADEIRKQKGLSLEEQQIKLDDLKFGFEEKVQGIRGEQAQAVSDYNKLVRSGNYSQEQLQTFATAMNIPTSSNPLYQNKLKLETAQANMAEFEAKWQGKTPPEGTLEYLNYKKAELELKIAQAESQDITGEVPDDKIKDIFYQDGMGRYGDGVGKRQCGEAYNDITTGKKVGDTYASKMATVTKRDNPQVGNGLTIPIGNSAIGHQETVIESNPITGTIKTVSWNRDGRGTQTIQSYNISDLQAEYGDNWGFSDSRLKPEYLERLGAVKSVTKSGGGEVYNKFYTQAVDELNMSPKDAAKYAQENAAKEINTKADPMNDPKVIADTIIAGTTGMTIDDLPVGQRAEVAKELNAKKQEYLKNNDTVGYLQASGGGKPLDATAVQSLSKAQNVMTQMQGLEEQINSMDTGPIMGSFKSANPYDVDTAKLKAQLQAIVPNLARGVYGEVGVLTDNDIKNYIATLPNGFSTADQKKALLDFTKKTVAKSIEANLKDYAMAGYNVSGYTPVLESLGIKKKLTAEESAAQTKQWLDFGKSLISTYQGETGQYIVPEDHPINNYEF